MSNVEQPNPNTDDGFRAALEQAVATGKANDPGIPGQEPVTPTAPTGTTEGAQTTPGGELTPETQALVERFGGVEGLAKALNESQSHIGRQGNELGELRSRLEAVEQASAPATPGIFMSPDQIEEAIQQYGGQAVVEYVETQNNPHLLQAALEAWGEYEPFKAALFVVGKTREYEAATAAGPSPEIEDLLVERNLQMSAEQAAQKYPDWRDLSDVIEKALDDSSEKIQALVTSNDPEDRELGIEYVVYKARELKAAFLATPEGQAAAQAAKVASQVTTGSLVPVSGQGGNPNPNESDAVAAFKKELRETPSTSIFDGLQVPQGRTMPFGQ